MTIETGDSRPRVKPDWAELSGYDRIALMTMRAQEVGPDHELYRIVAVAGPRGVLPPARAFGSAAGGPHARRLAVVEARWRSVGLHVVYVYEPARTSHAASAASVNPGRFRNWYRRR